MPKNLTKMDKAAKARVALHQLCPIEARLGNFDTLRAINEYLSSADINSLAKLYDLVRAA